MAGKLKHAKVSAVADGADTAKVRPTDWNAEIRMSEGKNGQHPVRDSVAGDAGWQLTSALTTSLVNKTGGATVVGTVYVLDAANDGAFTTSNVQGSLRRAVVAREAVGNNLDCAVEYFGPMTGVKTQGSCARGQYVRLSATAGAIEDTGIAVSDGVAPPVGAVGYTTKAAAAGVSDVFWFGQTAPAAAAGGVRQVFRGLHLGTHPEVASEAAKVMLIRADEIAYDDGTIVTGWDREVADLAAAGAGGLDTGAEQASTWYELYAIGKSADGTGRRAKTANDKLLFHRAKDWFKDEEQTTDGDIAHLRHSTDIQRLAQGFQVDTAGPLVFVHALIKKTGAPTGSVWISVQADASGSPSNTPLATSDKVDVSKISGTAHWILFVFRTPATLAALTQYHLVMEADYAISTTAKIEWRGAASDVYARGVNKRFDGTNWQTSSVGGFNPGDQAFKAYIERNDAAVTMPAGYDQKALLSYVFNDGSSNLIRQVQLDRAVRYLTERKVGSFTALDPPTLLELLSYVPPRAVRARLGFAHDGAGRTLVASPLVRTGTVGNALADGATVRKASGSATTEPNDLFGDVVISHGQLYAAVLDATTAHLWVEGWDLP